ncbi:hypothetical protein ACFWIA_12040 [Streptomyces sp. NPDC127068]|uniref:hypothetical protein n=1 Tax=Streptomyces sp. NPDC127068 TaxID=3347127 RepID=UPI0036581F01
MYLVLKIVVVISIFSLVLGVLGHRFGPVEMGLGTLLLAAALTFTVKQHVSSRQNG